MKNITFFLSMLMLLTISTNSAWGAEATYSMTPDKTTTGSSATSYITTLTEFTCDGIKWKMNQWNPSSLQVKTNQSSAASEFRFYNTTAFSGKITKVVVKFSALTLSNTNTTGFKFVGGTSEVSSTTGGTDGTWNDTDKTLTWTPSTSDNFTYFAMYQNGKVATGTNKLATSDAIVVTYETSGGGNTLLPPTFSPTAGTYEGTQNVTITSTEGATIYYTTDGSTPTINSNVYSSAITVNADMTIKAYAVKSGLTDSEIATAEYIITEGPDLLLDFTDNTDWNFPLGSTNKIVEERIYSKDGYSIKVAGSTGNGYYFNDGKLLLGKTGAYITLPTFEYPVEKIVCPGVSGASGKVTWNIYKGTTAVCSEVTGCTTDQTFEFENPEENNQYTIRVTNGNNLQISKIKIYYGEAPAVAKPTISGDESFVSTTTITISHADADAIYYTTNGDAPTTSSTQYSEPFTLNATSTVKAIAVKGSDVSAVAEKTFDKIVPMTVAQAKSAVDAATSNTLANQYVKGIISQVDGFNSTYNSITYWISDDGTTTNQFEVYSGKGLNNTNFSAATDLNVGDDVTVFGIIKLYNSTYEFDKNNYIVARKPIAVLSWSDLVEGAFTASLEGENTYPTLNKPNGISVTYNSSNTAIATISAEGAITPKAIGQTTITATFAGNDSYKANSVSYSLNVASSVVRVNVTFEENGGSAVDDLTEQTNLPSPLPATTKAGKNFGGWYTDSEFNTPAEAGASITENTTLYAQWLEPYTVAQALAIINVYADNGTSDGDVYVAGIISQIDSYNSQYHSITYWISDDGETTTQLEVYSGKGLNGATFNSADDLTVGDQVVVYGQLKKFVKNSTTTPEINQNNQLYSRQHEEIAITSITLNETSLTLKEGKDFTLEATIAPNNASDKSVIWASSNTLIATVEDGVISAVAIGRVTITCTSVADPTITATCSVTVTDPNARTGALAVFKKVTSTAEINDGEYLIVYDGENSAVAFDGALETLDAVSNTISVTIENDMIVAYDDAAFTIDATAKTIKSHSGKYIGQTSNANGLVSNASTSYENTMSIDEENFVAVSGGAYLRYNATSGQERFRYFKSSTYTSQKAIQLYKKVEPTSIRGDLTEGKWGTICPQKKVLLPSGASFFTIAYVGMENGVPYKVFFDEIGEGESLQAGQPYVYIANDDAIKGVPSGDPVAEGSNDHGFIGVLSDFTFQVSDAASQNKYYVIYENQIRLCGDGWFKLLAGRAYIDVKDPNLLTQETAAPAPGRRRISLSNPQAPQTATGIDAIESNGKTVKVMIGEQLFILRDGKLYDTTGRLVK